MKAAFVSKRRTKISSMHKTEVKKFLQSTLRQSFESPILTILKALYVNRFNSRDIFKLRS